VSDAATRTSYDAIATDYANALSGDLERRPFDRAMLSTFAELARAAGPGRVADVGCGPGRVTVVLESLGLDAFGIDLSPGMVALARETYPNLHFEVGSMLALNLPDATLSGLIAYFSIIHIPWDRRPEVFAGFHRALKPGAPLMLAFQVGSDIRHRDEAFGKQIDLHFHRQQPDEVNALLKDAGFVPWVTAQKEPEGDELTPQAVLIARRATTAGSGGGDDPRRDQA
jgi:ubiquinone/menaquinone biosynthesis C-methylase UbiE